MNSMEKHAGYWLSQSDGDLPMVESLLEKGHYTWCLFVGHLILKKFSAYCSSNQ